MDILTFPVESQSTTNNLQTKCVLVQVQHFSLHSSGRLVVQVPPKSAQYYGVGYSPTDHSGSVT